MTHFIAAVIVDNDLARQFPNIQQRPFYIEFEVAELMEIDVIESVLEEHSTQNRGGHAVQPDDIELKMLSITMG